MSYYVDVTCNDCGEEIKLKHVSYEGYYLKCGCQDVKLNAGELEEKMGSWSFRKWSESEEE